MHRVFQRQDLALPDPVPQEVGRQWRVAQLADMGTGIGQPERAARLVQQQRDPLGVVVGQDRLDPQGLEIGLIGAQIEQRVERIGAALRGHRVEPGSHQVRMGA